MLMSRDSKAPAAVARNKKARFKFEVLEVVQAGLVLRGTEVKSLRQGRAGYFFSR